MISPISWTWLNLLFFAQKKNVHRVECVVLFVFSWIHNKMINDECCKKNCIVKLVYFDSSSSYRSTMQKKNVWKTVKEEMTIKCWMRKKKPKIHKNKREFIIIVIIMTLCFAQILHIIIIIIILNRNNEMTHIKMTYFSGLYVQQTDIYIKFLFLNTWNVNI